MSGTLYRMFSQCPSALVGIASDVCIAEDLTMEKATRLIHAIGVLSERAQNTLDTVFDEALLSLGVPEDCGEIYLLEDNGREFFWDGSSWKEALDVIDGPLSFDEEF